MCKLSAAGLKQRGKPSLQKLEQIDVHVSLFLTIAAFLRPRPSPVKSYRKVALGADGADSHIPITTSRDLAIPKLEYHLHQ